MKRPSLYLYVTVTILIVGIGFAAWLLSSVTELHTRLARQSTGLGVAFLAAVIVVLAVAGLWAARLFWQSHYSAGQRVEAPDDVIQAAAVQTEQAEGVIRQIGNAAARMSSAGN